VCLCVFVCVCVCVCACVCARVGTGNLKLGNLVCSVQLWEVAVMMKESSFQGGTVRCGI